MKEKSLKPIIERLEKLFSMFNKKFYNGTLQRPVITVSPDNTKGAYGWCTAWKAWKEDAKDGEGYYEINLCAEYLSRPFEETAGTLLHEMAHLHNIKVGVQDTSRGGFYHNAKFKAAAENHGLTVKKSEKYGWSKTALNDEAKAFVDAMQEKKFEIFRNSPPKISKASKKQSSRKYVCPSCGAIIRATKEVHVICGDCEVEFEEAD